MTIPEEFRLENEGSRHILDVSRQTSELDGDTLTLGGRSGSDGADNDGTRRCLQWLCFRSTYSLRFQLFLSFGLVTVFSIFFVMIMAIVATIQSGSELQRISRANLQSWATTKVGQSSRYVAETMTQKLFAMEGLARIMVVTTQERFIGYPDAPGYEDDSLVPFYDIQTQTNRYPLSAATKIPLDWNWTTNINQTNWDEHLQHRYDWYDSVGTAHPVFRLQGACDPNAPPGHPTYFHNCTAQSNDITTGGNVAPTTTARLIHAKSSDYAMAVLKPLFEHHKDVHLLGIYFANDGAGAVVNYPSKTLNSNGNYTSAGCAWMKDISHPHLTEINKTIGTTEQISRCHSRGSVVNNREYNPLERTWCQQQAIHPMRVHKQGPYLDAFSNEWLMTFGQAVYDLATGEFLACTVADVSIDRFLNIIDGVNITNSSQIALVRWDEGGTVVASALWNNTGTKKTIPITELDGMGVTQQVFDEMRTSFSEEYASGLYDVSTYDSFFSSTGQFFSSFPVPVPPEGELDENYKPEFMVIIAVTKEEILSEVDNLDESVQDSVSELRNFALISGFIGLTIVLCVIHLVSCWLTAPMVWMSQVGNNIIHSFGTVNKEIQFEDPPWVRYTPSTEISQLVTEFQKMVEKFSGTGTAKFWRSRETEIKNPFDLHDNFRALYQRRNASKFPYTYTVRNSDSFQLSKDSRKHWGPSHRFIDGDSTTQFSSLHLSIYEATTEKRKNLVRSPLFWWMFISITAPLLLVMLTVSIHTTYNISESLPDLVEEVENLYVQLERQSLSSLVHFRAEFAVEVISAQLRDLHLYYRLSGWVLFGALQRSDSYTKMTTLANFCKTQEYGTCTGFPSEDDAICDCSWDYKLPSMVPCQDYGDDARRKQVLFWVGLSEDAFANGDRNRTSFPAFGTHYNNTEFWEDQRTVPGHERGSSAAGYETTYDRLRVSSATSVLAIPLLNYGLGYRTEPTTGVYLAFDQDGMLLGYSGCAFYDMTGPHYQANNLTSVNPNLCLPDKFGYDAQCRTWYLKGKEIALDAAP